MKDIPAFPSTHPENYDGQWLYKAREGESITFSELPKPVGFWVLYPGVAAQTRFAMYQRPTDEQIKNTEALLGWGWEEA